MTAPIDPGHFAFPELSAELARIDRPWRRLWLVTGLLGLAAAAGGAVMLYEVWSSGSRRLLDWLGPAFLVGCLAPAFLGFWARRQHPPPPTEAWITGERVTLGSPGRAPAGSTWSALRRPLVIGDFRSTPPTWRQDGSARTVDFVLLRTARMPRTPLPSEAVDALLAAARSNRLSVQEWRDVATRQGIVHLVRVQPPRR